MRVRPIDAPCASQIRAIWPGPMSSWARHAGFGTQRPKEPSTSLARADGIEACPTSTLALRAVLGTATSAGPAISRRTVRMLASIQTLFSMLTPDSTISVIWRVTPPRVTVRRRLPSMLRAEISSVAGSNIGTPDTASPLLRAQVRASRGKVASPLQS